MNRMSLVCLLALIGVFVSIEISLASDVVAELPELMVVRQGKNEICAMPAGDYQDFTIEDDTAHFKLTGIELPAGTKRIMGKGIKRVSWAPDGSDTDVTIEFENPPVYSTVNTVRGTESRPMTAHVIAGFGFDYQEKRTSPVMGSKKHIVETRDPYGNYDLPEFAPVKYSDALVSLNVRNVDFRDVLWLMSEIGNVSIMLDPYWDDEPTGSPRPVGGGAIGDGGGSDGGSPGFRPGDGFVPTAPREGTGRLTLNFKDVPFDTALELVVMSVGLVKVDIYPKS